MSDTSTTSSDETGPSVGKLVPVRAGLPAQRTPYGPYPAQAGEHDEAEGELRALVFEYLRIVMKRKWLIVNIALAAVAIGTVRTLMMTPIYTASARIQIDRDGPNIVAKGEISAPSRFETDFMRTQIELLQSRAIAERVASSLNLANDRDFFEPKGTSITGAIRGALSALFSGSAQTTKQAPTKAQLERAAAAIIQGNRAVRPVAGSRLVDVIYSDPNPLRAQRIAMAYVEAYIASTIDKRFEANAYAKTFLEDQLKQLKLRLEESEGTLLDFAQKEQIVVVSEKASIAENNLSAANAALGTLISERMKNENQWRQVESTSGINLPQLLTNSVIDGLRGKRNTLVTEYEEKLQTFKPSYPDMVQISNKIKEIDRQLASEVETIKQSLKAGYESALAQENETKVRVAQLKSEVIDLQKRSVQYNILKREVDTNRELYNSLLQRFKEIDVAGGVQASTVFVVERAEVPGAPSSPNLSRALFLAFALGLGGGLAAAYLLEKLDDTVRAPEEMERTSGLATLGIIPLVDNALLAEDALADPRSALSEAYRSLATSLQFTTDSGLPKTLLITSSGPGEGKSLTSLAIARHFATMGLKVLLIDADLRNASLHKKLKLNNEIGLTNVLTGACAPPHTFQRTAISTLAFMASGPLPPNAADLLAGPRLVSLLSVGLQVFDFIVVDGPPVMGLADAAILSNTAQATVFVVGAGQARSSNVRESLRRLQLARCPLIGGVLTKYDAKAAGYGYGYGYGNRYGYGGYGAGYGKDAFTYGQHAADASEPRPQLQNPRVTGS